MPDVIERLAHYREYAEEIAPPLDVEEVLEPARREVVAPVSLRWSPLRVALAAAVAVLILVGLPGLFLLARSDEQPPADTPTSEPPTQVVSTPVPGPTQVPTTVAPGQDVVPPDANAAPVPPLYEAVPSFEGTVVYREHGAGVAGAEVTIRVTFDGSHRFRYEVLSAVPTEEGTMPMGGPGTLIIGDGTGTLIYESPDVPGFPAEQFDPLRHLFWDGAGPAWNEICGPEPEVLGTAIVAGRQTSHLSCSTALEDYEIWLDETTGVVLAADGPFAVGDFSPYTDRDGGFEFQEVEFGPVTLPEPPPQDRATGGSIPSVHLVEVRTSQDGSSDQSEVWYRDAETWRENLDDGSFYLRSGGELAWCFVGELDCGIMPAPEDFPVPPALEDPPRDLVAETCAGPTDEPVLGRTAARFDCEGIGFTMVAGSGWSASRDPQSGSSQWWFDEATGIVLRHVSPGMTTEVIGFTLDPGFPEGLFEYEPIEFPDRPRGIGPGEVAPTWTGTYLDGTSFDLNDLRGRPAIFYDWFPTCGDICLDGITEFEALYQAYGDRVQFMSVVEDLVSEAQRLVDRYGLTVPTVGCFLEESDHRQELACYPDSLWSYWHNPVPSWTLLDAEGRVSAVVLGSDYSMETIETLIQELLAAG